MSGKPSSDRETLIRVLNAQHETIRRACRYVEGEPGRGLFNFCKIMLDYRDIEWDVHGDMCRRMENAYFGRARIVPEGAVQPYLYLEPRGSLKTSIITIGSTLWAFHLNDPNPAPGSWEPPPAFNGKLGYNQRFLIGSEIEPHAKRMLKAIVSHLESNGKLHTYFGSAVPEARGILSRRRWTDREIDLSWRSDYQAKEANITIMSVDAVVNSGHYDIGIEDDLIGERTAYSEVWRERAIDNHKALQPLMEKPSILAYVGTRWHDLDLYAYFTSSEQSEEHTRFITVVERSERSEEEIAVGKSAVFWPKRYPQPVLDDMRVSMGPWFFSCQMNNEPIDQATARFKKEYFADTRYDFESISKRVRYMTIVTTCDPAISDDRKACFAVVLTCGWDHEGHCWILDMFRERGVSPRDYIEEIFRQNAAWKPLMIGLEKVSFQATYHFAAEELARERRVFLPWAELPGSKERKELRIEGLEPLCAQKKIHWQARHHELITELLRYPRGAYRDAADALAYQPELAFRGSVPKSEPDPKDPFVAVQRSFQRLGSPQTSGGRVKNFWRDA